MAGAVLLEHQLQVSFLAAGAPLVNIFGIEIITESLELYMLICGATSIVSAPTVG